MGKQLNKMKECRLKKGYSMKTLSLSTGISERYLYFIENGERNPSMMTAKKIANLLEENIEHIFFDSSQN